MPPIHPDLTAYRAVEAEGGTHTKQDIESGWAAGFDYAIAAVEGRLSTPPSSGGEAE